MTFWSALILGLLASAHCAGMCAGLQMAMLSGPTSNQVIRSQTDAIWHVALLNFGRMVTYVSLGVVFTLLSYTVVAQLNISAVSRALRIATALTIVLIGIQLLMRKKRPFQRLEQLASSIWRPISKLIVHDSNRRYRSFLAGIAWGFLPCGLVYGVLLTSVFSADVFGAGLVMLGFAIGTMPALVLSGLLFKRFQSVVSNRYSQTIGGLFFILGGLAMLTAPYWVSREFLNDYPLLLNTVFCIT
ncbi:sulfite exporter TauE/SafE family protein [Arenicella xantha]|uniref:Urease accessory protein UreH-like transmembrane domain-containing protein n=1 Tax=Arenicella xantha TaxID=644221 RepID=A0A395JIU0_9GAMM|nr:sulfite exporter TauE/SafE family protein [Arenicella xantha]RBP50693.1 hypothetical protein DFR28_102104 [Arenicella xantha]